MGIPMSLKIRHWFSEFYFVRTVHIFTINISTNKRTHFIQFMASTKLLHFPALGCQFQGVFQNKAIQVQNARLGTVSPSLELLVLNI